MLSKFRGSGRVGSGRVGSGRVGSGRVGSGRVESGQEVLKIGWVESGRSVGSGGGFRNITTLTRPRRDPARPASSHPIRSAKNLVFNISDPVFTIQKKRCLLSILYVARGSFCIWLSVILSRKSRGCSVSAQVGRASQNNRELDGIPVEQ